VLDRLLSGGKPPRQPVIIQPGGIAVRRSTDVLAFDDEHVSAAMRLIHEHAADGISMKELIRRVPVSRKWLDIRFKALVGHTPSQEIRKLRLAHVQDMLLQTDLSIQQIAIRCGFSCGENLIRFFRDACGLPPRAYRRQNSSRRSV
jgi:LacI family transcriptional regulator